MFSVSGVLAQTISVFASIIKFLFFARIIVSWFMQARPGGTGGIGGHVINLIFVLTEPILGPLRGMLKRSPVSGVSTVVDFSPIFAFFLIDAFSVTLINLVGLIQF